ncbi:MAG: hypothetical protein U0641_13895 [Anaerolineae bacterium]
MAMMTGLRMFGRTLPGDALSMTPNALAASIPSRASARPAAHQTRQLDPGQQANGEDEDRHRVPQDDDEQDTEQDRDRREAISMVRLTAKSMRPPNQPAVNPRTTAIRTTSS